MGKTVSSDLRLRIVRGIAAGKPRRCVARQFEVSASTAVRVQTRYTATGSVAPARQGRPKGSGKLGACRQVIIDKVKALPGHHHARPCRLAGGGARRDGRSVEPFQVFVPARVHL